MSSFVAPASVEEAVRLLADGCMPLAGGTDVVVRARSGGQALPDRIASLHRLRGLGEIEPLADGSLRIGALVTHRQIEVSEVVRRSWGALADASALVGSPATRAIGTLGGNLCNASPAMETGSPLLIADASVELISAAGARSLALGEFLRGPGRTALEDGELLSFVLIPGPAVAERHGSAYLRLDYREGMEIAIVGVAASISLDTNGSCADARIALTAVAPTCVRARNAERALVGAEPSAEALAQAAELTREAAEPIADVRAPLEYRQAMAGVIARRALERALDRALEQL